MCGTGEDIFRQLVGVGLPYKSLTGPSMRGSGVGQDHMLKAVPTVHQRGAFATLLYGYDTKRMQAARDKQASRVVPAIEVAAANDTNGHV
jgi:hypothetical protein